MNNNLTADKEQIKSFVQERLGCTCPDAVFDSIRVADHSDIFTSASIVYDIGRRLFVALLIPDDWHDIEQTLDRLVDIAMHYRDQRGYNRFRFVIATHEEEAASALNAAFNALSGKDDRVHLHVIAPEQLPFDVAA